MFSSIVQASARQREILEVVLRNGWDYMRRLLTGGKADAPSLPPPAVLLNILIELGPVYIKLGQLLSTRPDLLPSAYIEALTSLQAQVPPVAWSEVEILIRQQLRGSFEDTFAQFEQVPVAAGSIAQTHKATLADGRSVAVKVQRPGIAAVVEQDIGLIQWLAELVSLTDWGEAEDLVALADEFGNALRSELDFVTEANYTDQLRRNLSQSSWYDPKQVVVPEIVWDLTTPKLLVMEWLDGVPVLTADFTTRGDAKAQQQAVATLLTRVFFQQICIDGFFHADPHPGNLFYLRDDRIALLDCGMIGRLDKRTQQALIEILLAIVSLDGSRCAQLTLDIAPSGKPVNLARLESEYDRLLRRYYNKSLAEINFGQVFYEILAIARENNARLPSNLGLCAKALANLEGVARTLNPDYNFSEQLRPLISDLFRRQLLGDEPLQALLRTALDIKSLSLESPRQLELLLYRVTSERFRWNLSLPELNNLRRSIDDSANRLSFSILVGSLIMGAAIISAQEPVAQVAWVSEVLFAVASLLGLWLIVSIIRSGRLR
ncbi:MAG: AarF/ABC1/UbiB kinase family protein [Oscillatoriaceae cyanobacterium]